MFKTGKQSTGRIPAFILTAGLLLTLIVLIAVPTLFAQDDVDPDTGVFVVSSQEDVEALPVHVKARMQKGISFGAADSYEISSSTKTAGQSVILAGEDLTFTIVVRNSGDADTPPMTMVDDLPSGLSYVSHECKIPDGGLQMDCDENSGVVTWEGVLTAGGSVEIVIVAKVANNATVGKEYTNVATITAGDKTAGPSAKIKVVDELPNVLLPMITYGEKPQTPDIISIQSTRPNSQNHWTVSWNGAGAVSYELQEAKSPGFANPTSIAVGAEASKSFAHPPSPYNVHYYRVRSQAGGAAGNWSQTLKVIGGYRDDFTDPNTGWAYDPKDEDKSDSGMRRISHLDLVQAWYEFLPNDIKWHILQVGDRFDLGLVSPMMEAPSIPYVINLEMKSPDPANMNGMGFVFAGDKRTDDCPSNRNTVEGWYEHKDCFNQFYEVMLIENPAGEKRDLIVQRVADIEWVGSGGGSIPVHRVVGKKWEDQDLSSISWGDWDAMRAEVFADRIEIYAGRRGGTLKHRLTLNENMYTGNPYFGTIATTQERPTATARFEYFEVMPLD